MCGIQFKYVGRAALRNCPLCASEAGGCSFPYFNKWNGKIFNYYKCVSCKSTFVDPVPDAADFAKMYSKSVYHDAHYNNFNLTAAQQSIARVLPYLIRGSSMLDFGCGNGAFLLAAKDAGFACVGVEYEKTAREAAGRNSGCPVISFDELIEGDAKFDVIHLGDVLEHLAEPNVIMSQLRAMLASGGRIYIEGPLETNPSVVRWFAVSFASIKKKLGGNVGSTTPPTHLFMTNAKAQRAFFTDSLGYRCVDYFIYETGWPYLNSNSESKWAVSNVIKGGIGRLAVVASHALPVLGNRFVGIFQP